MLLVILGASLEELVHGAGTWMFPLHRLPGEGQNGGPFVGSGQGEGKVFPFVDLSVAGDSGAGRGWEWGKVSGLQVPRRGTAVCYQLLGFGEAIFPL